MYMDATAISLAASLLYLSFACRPTLSLSTEVVYGEHVGVVGTLSRQHNFEGTLSRYPTLDNIYETITLEQDKNKTL